MKYSRIIAIAFTCLIPSIVSAGQVYKCVDDAGKKSFQSRPCSGTISVNSHKRSASDIAKLDTKGKVSNLSADSLQGQWLITHVGNEATADMGIGQDIWEFKGNKWTTISSGHRMRPETFSVSGSKIDFGSFAIDVMEYSQNKMMVDAMGIKQRLIKR